MQLCVYVHTHTRTHARTHVRTHTTHTHTHTHTHCWEERLLVIEEIVRKIQVLAPCGLVNKQRFVDACLRQFVILCTWWREGIAKLQQFYQTTRRHALERLYLYQYHRAVSQVVSTSLSNTDVWNIYYCHSKWDLLWIYLFWEGFCFE